MLTVRYIQTPIGEMFAATSEQGICVFDFRYRRMMDHIMKRVQTALGSEVQEGNHQHLQTLTTQISEYFLGTRQSFDVPLHLIGTPFQIKVWQGLREIPYAETRSYKRQSLVLGDEKAIRAVARANGENGLAIIIPCHRVIGENGSLVGYGGGLHRKQWLLEHERKHSGKTQQRRLFEDLDT